MRYLYVYDPTNARVTDKRDVSALPDSDVELLKIDLILRSHFPLEVMDSAIEGMPTAFVQPNSANIPRNRL